jgi:hypothetical protein
VIENFLCPLKSKTGNNNVPSRSNGRIYDISQFFTDVDRFFMDPVSVGRLDYSVIDLFVFIRIFEYRSIIPANIA